MKLRICIASLIAIAYALPSWGEEPDSLQANRYSYPKDESKGIDTIIETARQFLSQ